MNYSRVSDLLRLGFAMMMAVAFTGCGMKADPSVPGVRPVTSLTGLQLEKGDKAIFVRWPAQTGQQGSTFFRLERSGLDPRGTACPGCPRTFETITEIAANDPVCREANNQQCRYMDSNVLRGYHYIYRLLSCDGAGRCEKVSSPAEIRF